MNSFALAPSSVLLATLNRKMSPVEMRGIDRCDAMKWA